MEPIPKERLGLENVFKKGRSGICIPPKLPSDLILENTLDKDLFCRERICERRHYLSEKQK